MAIVQASMAEEILNRSERAVIRGIYRASQLAEAKVSLLKTVAAIKGDVNANSALYNPINQHVTSLIAYLDQAMCVALVSTKVPALRKSDSEIHSPKDA